MGGGNGLSVRARVKIAAVAALALAVGLGFWLSGRGSQAPRVLATAEVKMGEVRKVLQATGIVKAQVGAIVRIGARATGTIQEMRVRVGDAVRADWRFD